MLPAAVLVMALMVLTPSCEAQRPSYHPNPWTDFYPDSNAVKPAPQRPGSVSSSSSSSSGLGDRIGTVPGILVPVQAPQVTFRYFNNVAIQGPEAPCVGCLYMLTANGFVRA